MSVTPTWRHLGHSPINHYNNCAYKVMISNSIYNSHPPQLCQSRCANIKSDGKKGVRKHKYNVK